MSLPVINGRPYDGGKIECRVNGIRLYFDSINYSDNREQGEVVEDREVILTPGIIKPSGSASMKLSTFNTLMQMSGALGGYGRALLTIVCTYGDLPPITDTLQEVSFSPSADTKAGSDAIMRSIDLKYRRTLWNGVPFYLDVPSL